jgi:ABC-type multidrug transport system, ATPase component
MDEAEICDKVAIMDHGRIVAFDSPYNLKRKYTSNMTKIRVNDSQMLEKYLSQESLKYKASDGFYKIYSSNVDMIIEMATRLRNIITDFETTKGTLNDVFLAITGKEIRA